MISQGMAVGEIQCFAWKAQI